MKTHWLAIAALPLLAAPALLGQGNQGGGDNGRLTRVARRGGDEGFDRDAWKKKLSDTNLDEREKAADELARLARKDGDARAALEEWSKSDAKDRELAWTSRMLLRETGRNPSFPGHPKAFGGGNGFGSDFDFDEFSRQFNDLDSMFGDLREQWGDALRAMPAPSGGGSSSSKSMSLNVGPDGVTCEVTEQVDGKEEKHTYTAKTMEELLEAHPELRDSLGDTRFQFWNGSPHAGVQVFPRGSLGGSPRARAFAGPQDRRTQQGPPTDRLGLMCSPMDEGRAGELGLEHGVGLSVVDVQPDTIASLLGVRAGDVVVEVNGTTIHGTEDVKKILAERASDADVSVVVVGEGGHRRTLTWKPNVASAKPEGKSGSRNL